MKKIWVDDIIACSCLCMTIIIVILNVSMRYLFNSPIKSAEEIATIAFVWAVFVGGAGCYRKKLHMGVDILTQILPYKLREKISLIIMFLLTLMNGTFFYLSVKFTYSAYLKPTPVLGISSAYENSALIVGFGLIFVYSIIGILSKLKNKEK